jgi:hypothetical protein
VNVTACPAWLGLREEVSVVAVELVTTRVAVLVSLPPSKERVTVLDLVPAVVAVTLTLMTHVPVGDIARTWKLTDPLPAAAVAVPPLQPLALLSGMLNPLGVATTSPDGSVLAKFTLPAEEPPNGSPAIVYVSVAVPPSEIEDGLNDTLKLGAWADAAVADRAAQTSAAANTPNQRDTHAKRDTINPHAHNPGLAPIPRPCELSEHSSLQGATGQRAGRLCSAH